MRYAKGDPMVRMLMRMKELDQEPGTIGPIGTITVTEGGGIPLHPMIVTLRADAPPPSLKHRTWNRVASSIWTVALSLEEFEELDRSDAVGAYERASILGAELGGSVEEINARFPQSEWY